MGIVNVIGHQPQNQKFQCAAFWCDWALKVSVSLPMAEMQVKITAHTFRQSFLKGSSCLVEIIIVTGLFYKSKS